MESEKPGADRGEKVGVGVKVESPESVEVGEGVKVGTFESVKVGEAVRVLEGD